MNKLGLGLIAADSYFREGDARKARDYQQALRDADLSLLPDRTQAAQSGYRDQVGNNEARARLRPQETANREQRLGLESQAMAGDAERMPVEQQTRAIQSGMALSQAQSDRDNQPVKQGIERNALAMGAQKSAQDLLLFPEQLAQQAASGAVDSMKARTAVLATLQDAIGTGDPGIARDYVQRAFSSGLFPQFGGKQVGAVGVAAGPDGKKVFVVRDNAGQDLFKVTPEQLAQARAAFGKTEYKAVNAGDTLVAMRDGKATPIYTAPDAKAAAGAKQHTPAEVQTMEWLIGRGVAKDPGQAWEMVRSAREKTRNQFIMDYVAKGAGTGQDGTKLAAEANRVYDQVRDAKGGPGLDTRAPQSNSQPSNTLNDAGIKSLLGLP